MELENKTAESFEENENKENQDVNEFSEQLIIKSNSLGSFCPIINLLLTHIARSRLLDFGLVLFLRFYKNERKKTWPISSKLVLLLG